MALVALRPFAAGARALDFEDLTCGDLAVLLATFDVFGFVFFAEDLADAFGEAERCCVARMIALIKASLRIERHPGTPKRLASVPKSRMDFELSEACVINERSPKLGAGGCAARAHSARKMSRHP